MPSKTFGPTASAADTLTQIGSTYSLPPGPKEWFIYKASVGKGNVVNGTINAGFLYIETVKRTYHFAYGNGGGGATNNAQNGPAEQIDMCIPVPANTAVKVYVLDVNICADVTVSLQFADQNYAIFGGLIKCGKPEDFKTLAAGGVSANADTAADTEESFTVSAKLLRATLQPEADGKIYQIRFAGSGIVDAKAGTHKIALYIPGQAGPWEYALGNGPGGATLGGPDWGDCITIPEGIPVKANAAVDIKITSAEICKSPAISASYW